MKVWFAIAIVSFVPATIAWAEDKDAMQQFENEVRPILAGTCFSCHGGKKISGGLRVDSREALVEGGDSGPAIVPGKPDDSLLLHMVDDDEPQMPPNKRLQPQQVAALQTWIRAGAPWPEYDPKGGAGAHGTAVRGGDPAFQMAPHWAFQPPKDVSVPPADAGQSQHPIDRLLAVKLRENGLTPVSRAGRATLARRAYFDLHGLPPSPNEMAEFLADEAPDAFSRLVDRLLASPRYGERWGRYWLDVARYADTAGDNADYPIPSIRLYRDYVIDSFNKDKPYDQFLREQLAGDLLVEGVTDEERAERVIATGYLALSRRYGTEMYQFWHLVMEDTIDTVGQSMLGLTMRCARCHDHKFDPITQEDYYSFYGIFASTRYPFAGSEAAHAPRNLVPLRNGSDSPQAYAVLEGMPTDVPIQKSGEPDRPGAIAPRRPPQFLLGNTAFEIPDGQSGRRQLAEWITRPDHPLTPRVMVNRIWQHHFGKALVPTPSNFGANGAEPTHPELLDWLAQQFVANGWSIKAMHRLMMLSDAYQRSTEDSASASAIDQGNRWYWRCDRQRLDAEAIRDSLLAVSGSLKLERPGSHPFPSQNQWDFTQHSPFRAEYASPHRSIYLMTQRFQRHTYLALFDGPDTNATTSQRTQSIVPSQSLYLMNNPFVREQAAAFAKRLINGADQDAARVELAFRLALARAPNSHELERSLKFITEAQDAGTTMDGNDRRAKAWTSFAHVMLMSNEFLFVD